MTKSKTSCRGWSLVARLQKTRIWRLCRRLTLEISIPLHYIFTRTFFDPIIDPSVRDSLPSRINFSGNAFFHAFLGDSNQRTTPHHGFDARAARSNRIPQIPESRGMLRMLLLAPQGSAIICGWKLLGSAHDLTPVELHHMRQEPGSRMHAAHCATDRCVSRSS